MRVLGSGVLREGKVDETQNQTERNLPGLTALPGQQSPAPRATPLLLQSEHTLFLLAENYLRVELFDVVSCLFS